MYGGNDRYSESAGTDPCDLIRSPACMLRRLRITGEPGMLGTAQQRVLFYGLRRHPADAAEAHPAGSDVH